MVGIKEHTAGSRGACELEREELGGMNDKGAIRRSTL